MSVIGVLCAFDCTAILQFDHRREDLSGGLGFVTAVDVHKSREALSILTSLGEPTPSMSQADPLDPLLGGTVFGDDNGWWSDRW